jgi:aryl carrier-like protein
VRPYAYSEHQLRSWAAQLVGAENLKAKIVDNLHATVMWSKVAPAPEAMRLVDAQAHYLAEFDHFEYWDGHDSDGYLVAVLTSDSLTRLHEEWKRRGARHSFDDYLIHVTLHEKLRPTEKMLQDMRTLSVSLKGSWLSFTGENIQDIKS